jgi:hypothetical protein
MKASRLLSFLVELTVLSRKHGVVIRGNEFIADDAPGRYMVDINDTGDGEGIVFCWVPDL